MKFTEIKWGENTGELIQNWSHITIDQHDNVRLYFKPDSGDQQGFCFACVKFVSCDAEPGNEWEKEDLEVEILIAGEARFDGMRHIFSGADEFNEKKEPKFTGYLYYPDTTVLARLFTELSKLEREYCSDLNR